MTKKRGGSRLGRLGLCSAAVVAALLGSCAYFNIYWMAQQEYEKATSKTVYAEFWDPYAQQKPTGDNLRNIESCTKRCGKILLLYSKSKLVDDALVLMGNCFVLKGEYANATRKYEELLKFYPSSELADEARYMKAYTQVLDGSAHEALISLEGVSGEIRKKKWQERVIFLSGRICQKNSDCEKATGYFQTYVRQFPNGQKIADVTLALGECLIKMDRQGEALAVLEPLAKKDDLTGAMAAMKLGRAYRKLDQRDKALEIFKRLSGKAFVDSIRARADIETAITLDGKGDFEGAIVALSAADSLAKTTLGGEAAYRIGLVYEKEVGDFAKAVTSYDEAAKASSEFGKLASTRATALKAVTKYEQALSDSTAQAVNSQAMNRFLLAEAYLMDLGLATKAEEQLRVLSDSLPMNPFTARSMLRLGSLLEADGDTLARRYYWTVIDSFPNTVYANMARARLALPPVDLPVAPAETLAVPDTVSGRQMAPGVAPIGSQEGSLPAPPTSVPGQDTTLSRRPPHRRPAPQESLGVSRTVEPPDSTGASGDTLGESRDVLRSPWDTTGAPWDTTRSPQETTPTRARGDTTGSPRDTAGSPGSGRGDQ